MSIDIDWAALTTGPSGLALADSIRDFIHDKFQQVTLPRFIRSVHVHSFDFGDECPVVELKDISDPLPDFYEDDDDDEEEGGEGESSPEDAKEQAISEAAPNRPSSSLHPSNRAPTTTATKTMNPPPLYTARPRNLHLNLPFTPTTDQISTPFLSRSTTTTPGVPIPGRTSNFSYFHLPLSAGLSGAQTPLSHPHSEHPQPSSSNSPYRRTHPPPPPQPPFPSFSPQPPFPSFSPSFSPSSSSTTTTTSSSSGNQDDRTLDLQTTLHITYAGSLSLSLTAEILLDYPMPSFVGIPLKLQITGLSFDGVALVAYLRGRGGGGGGGGDDGGDGGEGGEVSGQSSGQKKKRKRKGRRDVVHFCFLGREDAGLVVGEREAASHLDGGDGTGKSKSDGKGQGQGEEATSKGGGLLREIRVESEIGRQEGGKQVLKNVGKVEKFVLEQVRRIVEEEFVWPSFWTFLV